MMLYRNFILFLLVVFCMMRAASAADVRFVPNMPDVPLMAGLSVVDENDFEGYQVETDGDGALFANDVREYYFHELQDFDWAYKGAGHFEKDGQLLKVDVTEKNGHLKVIFTLQG